MPVIMVMVMIMIVIMSVLFRHIILIRLLQIN
jgi:hypothetical protein